MALKPTVLLYNFTDKRRKNKVNTFCAMHGIRVKTVEKEQYGKPLLVLVDKEAEAMFTEAENSMVGFGDEKPKEDLEIEQDDFSDEMLIMCQVGSKMNALLSYLRKEKVIVPLKAVMTTVNQFWDSVKLYREIRKEHKQMTGQEL